MAGTALDTEIPKLTDIMLTGAGGYMKFFSVVLPESRKGPCHVQGNVSLTLTLLLNLSTRALEGPMGQNANCRPLLEKRPCAVQTAGLLSLTPADFSANILLCCSFWPTDGQKSILFLGAWLPLLDSV